MFWNHCVEQQKKCTTGITNFMFFFEGCVGSFFELESVKCTLPLPKQSKAYVFRATSLPFPPGHFQNLEPSKSMEPFSSASKAKFPTVKCQRRAHDLKLKCTMNGAYRGFTCLDWCISMRIMGRLWLKNVESNHTSFATICFATVIS